MFSDSNGWSQELSSGRHSSRVAPPLSRGLLPIKVNPLSDGDVLYHSRPGRQGSSNKLSMVVSSDHLLGLSPQFQAPSQVTTGVQGIRMPALVFSALKQLAERPRSRAKESLGRREPTGRRSLVVGVGRLQAGRQEVLVFLQSLVENERPQRVLDSRNPPLYPPLLPGSVGGNGPQMRSCLRQMLGEDLAHQPAFSVRDENIGRSGPSHPTVTPAVPHRRSRVPRHELHHSKVRGHIDRADIPPLRPPPNVSEMEQI